MAKQRLKISKLDKLVKKIPICPNDGAIGFLPHEKFCNICGAGLLFERTIYLNNALISDWHRRDDGKHKNNPHLKWTLLTSMIDPELLDEIMDVILFGRIGVSIGISLVADKDGYFKGK